MTCGNALSGHYTDDDDGKTGIRKWVFPKYSEVIEIIAISTLNIYL